LKRSHLILVSFLLLALSSLSHAQRVKSLNLRNADQVPYHFGFQLGVNQMFFVMKTQPGYQQKMQYNIKSDFQVVNSIPDQNCDSGFLYNVESNPTYGFVIGIVGDLKLWKHFNLRFTPSLTFGERDLEYTLKLFHEGQAAEFLTETKNVQSTFVEFPWSLKFKGDRINNSRPYVLVGAKYALDLASNAKKKEDSNVTHVFIDKSDVYAHIGVGFDFYTAYFKFGTEVVMSYGLNDLLKHDATIYTNAITGLRSKIFQINFTFEGD
jgi:hypothetical protein